MLAFPQCFRLCQGNRWVRTPRPALLNLCYTTQVNAIKQSLSHVGMHNYVMWEDPCSREKQDVIYSTLKNSQTVKKTVSNEAR